MDLEMIENISGFDKMVDHFPIEKRGNDYFSTEDNKKVEFTGCFCLPFDVFAKLVEENRDRFSDVDYFVDAMQKPPIKGIVKLFCKEMQPYYPNRKYKVTREDSVYDKLYSVFIFFNNPVFIKEGFLLDNKPFLIQIAENLFTTEQILHVISISEFRLEPEFCEWDIDEENTLLLQFRHKDI